MERELFENFYKGNIEPIVHEVCKKHEEFVYQENIAGVFEEYLNQRSLLRILLKGTPDSEAEHGLLLDGHKISACITASIIKVRIIGNKQVADSVENPFDMTQSSRMNEQVALFSGLSCLLEFMADNDENLRLPTEDLIGLRFPKTDYEERSTILDSLVRALYYTNVMNGVSTLLLAHIFFYIEKYHRQSIALAKICEENRIHSNEIGSMVMNSSSTAGPVKHQIKP